jgi:lipooligosaccharide transport system permease protein
MARTDRPTTLTRGEQLPELSGAPLAARVLPFGLLGAARAGRLLERNLRVQRRQWWVILSGFFEPLFYLLSLGIGIGKLVGPLPGPGGTTVSYAVYVAPALLASSAMNGGIYESTFNVYFKLKFAKVYDAVLSTPLGPTEVAVGEIANAVLRAGFYSAMFVAMMAALGDIVSPWAVLAWPAAVLVGFAFAAAGMGATTYMRSWADFDLVQLAILPLFLFSATFYPLSTYPRWLQLVVECTPLYHGVALTRGVCLGAISAALVGHAAYLLMMGGAGLIVSARRIRRLLLS